MSAVHGIRIKDMRIRQGFQAGEFQEIRGGEESLQRVGFGEEAQWGVPP